jgi:hypothetical protein
MRYVLLLLAAICLVGCKDDPSAILKKYHYMTQVPPVSEHGPGNIVWKRSASKGSVLSSKNSVSLGYICDPRYVQFPNEPLSSPTESTNISKEIGGNLSFTGVQLSQIGISAAAKLVDKVNLKIENVSVLEYPLEGLYLIRSKLGPVCKEILQEQRKKKNAYQVISAVKADVSYTVSFKAGASAEAKAQLMNALGAKLGIDFSKDSAVVGKGLFYGVELDRL